MQYFESAACWRPVRACRGSSRPNRRARPPSVCEVADHGIVRVHDDRRLGRETRDRRAPALGHELELAVAVELVAEEVAEQQRARPHALECLRKRALVHLEQPELGAPRLDECRGQAGEEVRSRSIPGERVLLSRGSRPPSPWSWSSRSSPRRARRPAEAELPARPRRRDRASTGASPAAWCHRLVLRRARACRRAAPQRSRGRVEGSWAASVATGRRGEVLWETCRLSRTL